MDSMRQKYKIAIEESYVQEFSIDAENAEEAFTLAEKMYHTGEINLEVINPTFTQMSITQPTEDASEWKEI